MIKTNCPHCGERLSWITAGDGDPRHGTENGYNNLGCRCADCNAANTESSRRKRIKYAKRQQDAT